MTKTKFFATLSKLVANGFNVKGATTEVHAFFAHGTDLCIVIQSAVDTTVWKRISFHRKTKAANELCEKMNRWILDFNAQFEQVQEQNEKVEVATSEPVEVNPEEVTALAVAINELPNTQVMVSSGVLKAAVAHCPGNVDRQINKVVELLQAKLAAMNSDVHTLEELQSLNSVINAICSGWCDHKDQQKKEQASIEPEESYSLLVEKVEISNHEMKLRLFMDFTGQNREQAQKAISDAGGFLLGAVKHYNHKSTS